MVKLDVLVRRPQSEPRLTVIPVKPQRSGDIRHLRQLAHPAPVRSYEENEMFKRKQVIVHEAPTDQGSPETYTKELFKEYEGEKYRERFRTETAGLTDSQIFDVFVGVDDDQEDDDWRKLFLAIPRVTANIDGDALAEQARALGAKAGEATDKAINLVMKAKEDWQGGPFKVLFGLKMDFEDEVLSSFAVPDTDTGNNPDEFKVYKEDSKGKRKLVNSSFYVQFGDATPGGQKILERIEWTERAGDANMVKDDIPDDIKEMSPTERETHLNFLKGRRGTIRAAYKKAMALYFKDVAVNNYPGVKAEPIWVKGKSPDDVNLDKGELPEVENTTKPIAVWLVPDKDRPIAKWEAFSIGAFLKLNTKKAIEKGGTFAALIESGATKKKPGIKAKDKKEGLTIKTVETGVNTLAELHRWFTEIGEAKDKVDVANLYKLGNTKDNDEFVTAVFETADFLNHLVKDTGIATKYLKLQQGGSDLVKDAIKQGATK